MKKVSDMTRVEKVRVALRAILSYYEKEFPAIYRELRIDRVALLPPCRSREGSIRARRDNPFHIEAIRININGSDEEMIRTLIHECSHIVFWEHKDRHKWLMRKLMSLPEIQRLLNG